MYISTSFILSSQYLLKFLRTHLEALLEGLSAGLSHDVLAVGDLPTHSVLPSAVGNLTCLY